MRNGLYARRVFAFYRLLPDIGCASSLVRCLTSAEMSEPPHRVVDSQLQGMAASSSKKKKRMLVLIDPFSLFRASKAIHIVPNSEGSL